VASDLLFLSGRRDLIPYGCCCVKRPGQVLCGLLSLLAVCGHAGVARWLVAAGHCGDLR